MKTCLQFKGYTPTVNYNRFLYRGQHILAIAAMTCNGIVNYSTHVGGMTADILTTFYQLLCYLTLSWPHLQPFDGTNPCSIVVMDNATMHLAAGMVQLIEQAGTLVYCLPLTVLILIPQRKLLL